MIFYINGVKAFNSYDDVKGYSISRLIEFSEKHVEMLEKHDEHDDNNPLHNPLTALTDEDRIALKISLSLIITAMDSYIEHFKHVRDDAAKMIL